MKTFYLFRKYLFFILLAAFLCAPNLVYAEEDDVCICSMNSYINYTKWGDTYDYSSGLSAKKVMEYGGTVFTPWSSTALKRSVGYGYTSRDTSEQNDHIIYYYLVSTKEQTIRFVNEEYNKNFTGDSFDWYEYYLWNNLAGSHSIWAMNDAEPWEDAELYTVAVNGIRYYYVYELIPELNDSDPEDRQPHNWVRVNAIVGNYVFEAEFAWSIGGYGLGNGEEGLVTCLSYFRFPLLESGQESGTGPAALNRAASDRGAVYDSSTFRTKEAEGEKVCITGFFYESGYTGPDLPSKLEITFDHEIESINLYSGKNIYLCDADTDEIVFSRNYSKESYPDGSVRIIGSGNTLWWSLPASMYSQYPEIFENRSFERTFYVRIDDGFLSFTGTDHSIEIGAPGLDGRENNDQEWVCHLMSEESQHKEWYFSFVSKKTLDTGSEEISKIAPYVYDSSYFTKSSYNYDDKLATLSMDMAIASFGGSDYANSDLYIRDFFKELDFENIWTNDDYRSATYDHSTGVAIASKRLNAGTTLVAVAVRGGGYGYEWGGNFYVGTDTDHYGFSRGKDIVIEALKTYFRDHDVSGDIKLWLAGYSRASAIVNLTAAAIDDGVYLSDKVSYMNDDVFAYGFEVPASTRSAEISAERYKNIFSIVNPADPVPRMPLQKWGYARYGQVLFLPACGVDKSYDRYKKEMQQNFLRLYDYPLENMPGSRQPLELNLLMRNLYEKVPSVEKYSSVQVGMSELIKDILVDNQLLNGGAGQDVLALMLLVDVLTGEMDFTGLNLKNIRSRIDTVLLAMDFSTLMLPHYAEYTLAWMQTLEGTGVLEETMEPSSHSENSRYFDTMVNPDIFKQMH